MRRKTLGERIRLYVWAHGGKSATQIARAIKAKPGSVSAWLHKEWKRKTMVKDPTKGGPRGGATWY